MCGFFELLACVDSGDNDGDIFFCDVGWVFGEGYGSVGEGGSYTDEVPEVTEKAILGGVKCSVGWQAV